MKVNKANSRRGFSSIMAVIFVALFSMLAISFTAISGINIQVSKNHRDMSAAQAASESGLEFIHYLINDYIANGADKTFDNTVSDDDAVNTFNDLASYLQDKLNGNLLSSYQSIGNVVSFSENGSTGLELLIPEVSVTSSQQVNFSLKFRQYNNDLKSLEVISTGRAGQSHETALSIMNKKAKMLR